MASITGSCFYKLYPNPNIHPGVVRCLGLGYAWIGKAIAEKLICNPEFIVLEIVLCKYIVIFL